MTSPQGRQPRQPRGLPFKLQSPPSGYEQPTKRELRTASDRVDYPVSERRLTTTIMVGATDSLPRGEKAGELSPGIHSGTRNDCQLNERSGVEPNSPARKTVECTAEELREQTPRLLAAQLRPNLQWLMHNLLLGDHPWRTRSHISTGWDSTTPTTHY